MSTVRHVLGAACLALAVVAAPAQAQGHGGRWSGGAAHAGYHGHHGHRSHWSVGVGLGFGWWPGYTYAYPYPYAYPGAVYAVPAPVEAAPAPSSRPDPVFTPRRGQDAVTTETDLRSCNRQAMGDPAALSDAGVFHRSVLGCMKDRGYAVH